MRMIMERVRRESRSPLRTQFRDDGPRSRSSGSGGFAVVVVEQSAEAFAALDLAGDLSDFQRGINELIVESLVISLRVIMFEELFDGVSE